MPRGDKGAYTGKQKRMARKIAKGAKRSGKSTKTAERIAWATVNKSTGGGKKSGSGRGKKVNKGPMRKGGKNAAKKRTTASRKRAGKKAAATRKRRAGGRKKSST